MLPSENPIIKDSDGFTILLEHLFRQGLMQNGISFHAVTGGITGDSLLSIKVVLYSKADLADLECFLKSQFRLDEDRPVPTGIRKLSCLPVATYMASLQPARLQFPEWKGFAGLSFRIEVNSVFGEALQAAFSAFSRDRRPETADIPESERKRLLELTKELDEGFSMLYSSISSERKLFASQNVSGEPSLEELKAEEIPADVFPDGYIGQADVMLYFRTHPNILSRWSSIASESALRLQSVGCFAEDGENSRGLLQFLDFLQKRGLQDVHDMASFMEEKLGSWELLYEALETARVKSLLPSGDLSIFEFALALLKARERLS